MSIINIFNNEKDLFNHYLNDIFENYWEKFISFADRKNLHIRDVVFRDVKRMINYNSLSHGFSLYKYPDCGNEKIVSHTCKSRFYNSYGIKYSK